MKGGGARPQRDWQRGTGVGRGRPPPTGLCLGPRVGRRTSAACQPLACLFLLDPVGTFRGFGPGWYASWLLRACLLMLSASAVARHRRHGDLLRVVDDKESSLTQRRRRSLADAAPSTVRGNSGGLRSRLQRAIGRGRGKRRDRGGSDRRENVNDETGTTARWHEGCSEKRRCLPCWCPPLPWRTRG